MTDPAVLERRYRRLLARYPSGYRREYEPESPHYRHSAVPR